MSARSGASIYICSAVAVSLLVGGRQLAGAQLLYATYDCDDDQANDQAAEQAKAGLYQPGHRTAEMLKVFHNVVHCLVRPVQPQFCLLYTSPSPRD